MFWTRFTQGKQFATTQSKWDAMFIGISAMGRDEKMIEYIMRLVMRVLINFTIGVFGAVVAFIYSLVALVSSYKASLPSAFVFFSLASVAAISFAMTWIVGLYLATAGTVFVGAKLIASNMRIQDGGAAGPQQRVPYGGRQYRE
jgi:hypothetical protein